MGLFNKKKTEKGLKMSEEQLEKCFKAGEKFSNKMKLNERISKINKYGNEHPQRAFLYIFIGFFLVFLVGFLIPKPKPDVAPFPTVSPSEFKEDKTDVLKREIDAIYSELQQVSDTLSKALDKPVKTKEDSLFIMESYERFEQLQNIINKEFDNEQ